MIRKHIQYLKDRVACRVLAWFSGPERRLKTGMQELLLQLDLKGRWPPDPLVIELFGMHGLWHTRDYVARVKHLDFFEIDKAYLDLARKSLASYPVTFHQGDSIAWLRGRPRTFNFVVADIPYSGPFYADDGLPAFFDDLLHICAPGGVIVFNCHASRLARHRELERALRGHLNARDLSDIFYVPRNSLITYVVICLDQDRVAAAG